MLTITIQMKVLTESKHSSSIANPEIKDIEPIQNTRSFINFIRNPCKCKCVRAFKFSEIYQLFESYVEMDKNTKLQKICTMLEINVEKLGINIIILCKLVCKQFWHVFSVKKHLILRKTKLYP